MRLRSYAALGIALWFAAGQARAAESQPLPRNVRLEHKLEITDAGQPELHWQLIIPLENLVFQRHEGAYLAELRLAVEAEREGDGRVQSALWHARIEKPDFAASRSGKAFEESYRMPLGPGEWKVEALLYVRGPSDPWRQTADIEVPQPEEGRFFLQGPRWPASPPADSLSPPFRFQDPWQLSRDAAYFADGLDARVLVECDVLYWQESSESLAAVLSLEDRAGSLRFYGRKSFAPESGRGTLNWSLPVGPLAMGPHRLRLDVAGAGERQRIEGRLDVGLTRRAFGSDWEQTLELIIPIAREGEIGDLRAAPPSERLELWRSFWAAREGELGVAGEPVEEAYFQRLSEVCERFGSGFRPGYLSDQGRVYLELGPPDQIERVQDERNFGLAEYWHYTRLNRIYVFEDRHGLDEFVLVRVIG